MYSGLSDLACTSAFPVTAAYKDPHRYTFTCGWCLFPSHAGRKGAELAAIKAVVFVSLHSSRVWPGFGLAIHDCLPSETLTLGQHQCKQKTAPCHAWVVGESAFLKYPIPRFILLSSPCPCRSHCAMSSLTCRSQARAIKQRL